MRVASDDVGCCWVVRFISNLYRAPLVPDVSWPWRIATRSGVVLARGGCVGWVSQSS